MQVIATCLKADFYNSLTSQTDKNAFELVVEVAIVRALDSIIRNTNKIKGNYAQQLWQSQYAEPTRIRLDDAFNVDERRSSRSDSPIRKSSPSAGPLSPRLFRHSPLPPTGVNTGYNTPSFVPISPVINSSSRSTALTASYSPPVNSLRRFNSNPNIPNLHHDLENFSLNGDDNKTPYYRMNGG
jgi:hypothetical protein